MGLTDSASCNQKIFTPIAMQLLEIIDYGPNTFGADNWQQKRAGKNTGLPQKNGVFCEKTALMFFVCFSPFSIGRCAGPVRASSTENFASSK
jgi:hypothetical protein